MRALPLCIPLATLIACSGGAPAPAPADAPPAAPTCDLSMDGLAGKTFVLSAKGANGADAADVSGRVRFSKDGDKLKAVYNGKSLINMYNYSCAPSKEGADCWEDAPKADLFCKALIANDKECTPESVSALTGQDPAEITKLVTDTRAEVKKLKGADYEQFKSLFSSPNTPLRGVLHLKIKEEGCKLMLTDRYMTMSFGQVREMENLVGTAPFVVSDKNLNFETCTVIEGASLVALTAPGAAAKPGEHKRDWNKGESIPMAYVGENLIKAEPGCTYTQDVYAGGVSIQTAQPVAPDEKGALSWAFSFSFDKSGPAAFALVRSRTCEGKPAEKVDVACQAVSVQ